MGLTKARPPRFPSSRQHHAGHASTLAKLPAWGVISIAAVFLVIVFEFWLMHHHEPSTPHYVDPFIEPPAMGGVPPESTAVVNTVLLPDAPSKPTGSALETSSTPENDGASVQTEGKWIVETLPPSPQETKQSLEEESFVVYDIEHPGEGQAGEVPGNALEVSAGDREGYGDMRVAVLVPYSGTGLPPWFDAFADLAAASSDAVDWIIFCEAELAQVNTPPNVIMKSTSPSELAWLLAGVVYPADADEWPEIFIFDSKKASQQDLTPDQLRWVNARVIAAKFIQKLLSKNPYYMVEFKPALGWVFREYLKEYTHWAYGDLDVFFGDLTKGWLEPKELQDFDIITYSFGDQFRAYLRGQLTVHRSIPKVNRIWRSCPHLSNYIQRIQNTMKTKQYNLESAEGCYSMALMYSKNIKAKFAVKVFTDMPGGGQNVKEDIVITGDALVKRCPTEVGRRGDFVDPDYGKMQADVGPMYPVSIAKKGTTCEYWVSPHFQTCLQLEDSKTPRKKNVFLIEGKFYERDFINLWKDKVEDGCGMGAFHHFQNFKANYKPWNTRPPMPPVHRGMVAGNGGVVPLPNGDWMQMAVHPNAPPPTNRDRFTHRYCMRWDVAVGDKTTYTCDRSVTAGDAMQTLHDTRPEDVRYGRLMGGAAVTLGGVGQKHNLRTIIRSCREWEGPKIAVLFLSQTEVEEAQVIIRAEEARESMALQDTYIVAFVVRGVDTRGANGYEAGGEIPIKTLMNALADLCQTRHLLTLTPDFRLARGAETAVAAALREPVVRPRVLLVQQWCIDAPDPQFEVAGALPEVPPLTMDDLRERYSEGTAALCHKHGADTRNNYYWFGVKTAEEMGTMTKGDNGKSKGPLRGSRARRTQDGLVGNGLILLKADAVSPVMVVDLWSAPALFLRHVEELTRSRCFDGAYARGLWAAGFSFHVVAEAAAFSDTPLGAGGCREEAEAPIKAYAAFLREVRQVYSPERQKATDIFKLGHASLPETAGRHHRQKPNNHPFSRTPPEDRNEPGIASE